MALPFLSVGPGRILGLVVLAYGIVGTAAFFLFEVATHATAFLYYPGMMVWMIWMYVMETAFAAGAATFAGIILTKIRQGIFPFREMFVFIFLVFLLSFLPGRGLEVFYLPFQIVGAIVTHPQ